MARFRSTYTSTNYSGDAPVTVEATGNPDQFRVWFSDKSYTYLDHEDVLDLMVACAEALAAAGVAHHPSFRVSEVTEDTLANLSATSIFNRLKEGESHD